MKSGVTSSSSDCTYDIGNYIGQPIDSATKKAVLTNCWVPPKKHQFPFSEKKRKMKQNIGMPVTNIWRTFLGSLFQM